MSALAAVPAPTGTLDVLPMPALLHGLWTARRTCLLALTAPDGREKRLFVRDGAPVGCESNHPHETLLSYLVGKRVLEPGQAEHLQQLSQGLSTPVEQLLMQRGLLDAPALERHRQGLLAQRVLDCFGEGWASARYGLLEVPALPEGPRLSMTQLLLFGVANFFPAVRARRALPPGPLVRLPLSAGASLPFKPQEREAALWGLLAEPATPEALAQKAGLSPEEAVRRLYSLVLFGLVGPVPEEAPAAVPPAQRAPPAPEPPPTFAERSGVWPMVDIAALLAAGAAPASGVPASPAPAGAAGPAQEVKLGAVPVTVDIVEKGPAEPAPAPAVVVRLALSSAPAARAPADEAVEPADAASRPRPPRRSRVGLLAALAFLLLAGGGAALLWPQPASSPPRLPPAPAPRAAVQEPPPPAPPAPPAVEWAAAPDGSRAQPHRPRGLALSAAGVSLPPPVGRPLAAAGWLLRTGKAEAALARYEALARGRDTGVEVHYGAGLALYSLGRDAEARERLQQALTLEPAHPWAHLLLGYLQHQAAALEEARAHYDAFLAARPEDARSEDVRAIREQLPVRPR